LAKLLFRHGDACNLVLGVLKLQLEVCHSAHLDPALSSLHFDQRSNARWTLAPVLQTPKLVLTERQSLASDNLIDDTVGKADLQMSVPSKLSLQKLR
jgi:hypothetical protein